MPNHTLTLACLFAVGFSGAAQAREKAGVTLPDTLTVDGKALQLNGLGLRTKVMFKVYVAGLYLEKTSDNAGTVISSDQVKRVEMVMLRNLAKGKITDAMENGFEKNNKDKMPALKARLTTFTGAVEDLKTGDRLTVTYTPGQGTKVQTQSGKSIVVEGKDFADALFSVWFGKEPADEDLKTGMLGK